MLLVLFALSAHAQPSVYGSYYGAGTSGSQWEPEQTSNQQRIATPSADSAPAMPSIFELRQADRNVRLSETALLGDRAILNLDLGLFGNIFPPGNPYPVLRPLGNAFKADSAAQQERYFQREIDHIRANSPRLTQEERNKIDDYALQRDYAYNTKLRRGVTFVPLLNELDDPFGSLSNVYDVRAKKLGWILAQNHLTDAKRAYQKDPSRENFIELRNARDDVAQADHRQDASSYDLLGGAFGNAGVFGPVFRKKASETKLESGLRSLRLAREAYAKDPSQENRINLQMANVFVRATEEEDVTNQNEIVANLLFPDIVEPGPEAGYIWNSVLAGKNSEDETRLWLRHARLARQKLLHQRASAMRSESSPVAAQMLGLSMYGPRQAF